MDHSHFQTKKLGIRVSKKGDKRINLGFAPLAPRASHPLHHGLHIPISRLKTHEILNWKI